MRELKIAYGRSSSARIWKNTTVTWEELCEKFKVTVRTKETVEEYKNMGKDERAAAKDRGGFVGGHLKNGRRLVQSTQCRSLLTLDADLAKLGFIEEFEKRCKYAAAIYTTHGHTPESPRSRIVIPFTEEITPDCYVAVARLFAAQWGIDQFDECSYRVNQLMYWPTTPSDGEFICRIIEGDFMDAMEFLKGFPEWRDCSKLPVSSREKEVRVTDGRKQEDPLSKEGIVGAFCRTYGIEDAIRKFLTGVYAPSAAEGRYDYVPGEGTAGVVVYDDKFAYSHHATDPAGGMLLNAFDLVRVHRFGENDGKTSYLKMCALAEADEAVKETLEKERLEQARKDFEKISSNWEEPMPFGKYTIMPFPLDALPTDIRNYVAAISESVQTPADMAGCAALSVIAASIQGKYVILGKKDWTEPLNIYLTEIAPPSERKSAIHHAMTKPVSDYENNYNHVNAAAVETSHMHRRILERRQKAVEDQFAKGKATQADVDEIAKQLTEYEERKPLRLFADDITPEKLASVLAKNNGRMALLSSEAGIFDTLAGAYSKSVNIDVMLKSYSGDQIRVDRIGRESENIMNPTLTVLLMAQPNVISRVLSNETFRGRGLTARFLYCMPTSAVGGRKYRSAPVPDEVYQAYERCVFNMLEDEYSEKPEVITLSSEADALMEAFSQELEPKLVKEYAEIADWCGKLAGNVLRIAGLLCRAGVYRSHAFLDDPDPLVVDGATMENAIRLGRYFLNHAQAIFNVLPENAMFQNAHKILKMISDKGLKEFSRRTAMRNCQSFKRVEDIQPVLDFLEDYGYIAAEEGSPVYGKGRPPMPSYAVNPWVERYYCRFDVTRVIPRERHHMTAITSPINQKKRAINDNMA